MYFLHVTYFTHTFTSIYNHDILRINDRAHVFLKCVYSFFHFFKYFTHIIKWASVYILFFFYHHHNPSCPTVTNMQQDMDNLTFDLLDFDGNHRVFPINACPFMVNLCGIPIPIDTVPTFNNLFSSCLDSMSDFEAVEFYSDFTRLINT